MRTLFSSFLLSKIGTAAEPDRAAAEVALVSASYSRTGCRAPESELFKRFIAPGEKRNPKAIVQDSHFAQPLGYRAYVDYLKAEPEASPAYLARGIFTSTHSSSRAKIFSRESNAIGARLRSSRNTTV